jgi:transcription elongation factor GreA
MTHYLTKEGLAELQAELKRINELDLPDVLQAINAAMAQGDISENSALDSARLEHDKLLTRQAEIEEVLNHYEIIEESSGAPSKIIKIGSMVKIQYLFNNQTFELRIVGSSEADAVDNKISNESPLAQALLGCKESDTVNFKSRMGKMEVKILDILA